MLSAQFMLRLLNIGPLTLPTRKVLFFRVGSKIICILIVQKEGEPGNEASKMLSAQFTLRLLYSSAQNDHTHSCTVYTHNCIALSVSHEVALHIP